MDESKKVSKAAADAGLAVLRAHYDLPRKAFERHVIADVYRAVLHVKEQEASVTHLKRVAYKQQLKRCVQHYVIRDAVEKAGFPFYADSKGGKHSWCHVSQEDEHVLVRFRRGELYDSSEDRALEQRFVHELVGILSELGFVTDPSPSPFLVKVRRRANVT